MHHIIASSNDITLRKVNARPYGFAKIQDLIDLKDKLCK